MRCSPYLLRRLTLTALCLLLAPLPRAEAQKARAPVRRVNRLGTQSFRIILNKTGVKPLQDLGDLREDSAHTLLIVFGDVKVLDQQIGQEDLRAFLDEGGALLVASADPSDLLDDLLKVTPAGTMVTQPNRQFAYRGQRPYPLVTPRLQQHPIFANIKPGASLATNQPSYLLRDQGSRYHVLAEFPDGCTDKGGKPLGDNLPFAIGNDAKGGKVLVLAGDGVFINLMMANTPNAFFASNCVDWLTKDDDGKRVRNRVLFFDEGRIVTKINVDLVEIRLPPPELQRMNRAIREIEKENVINKFILDKLGGKNIPDRKRRMEVGKQRIAQWGLLILSVVVIFTGLCWVLGARYRRDLTVPLVANHLARNVATEPLVSQRQRGMIQEGNLWEAARELARQCFAAYAARSSAHPPPKPRAYVHGDWNQRRVLPQLVQQLWQLAFGAPSAPVTPPRFSRLVAEIDEVKQALAAGVLKLEAPAPPTPPRPLRRSGPEPAPA